MLQQVQSVNWPEVTFIHDGWEQKMEVNGKRCFFSQVPLTLLKIEMPLPATQESLDEFALKLELPPANQTLGVLCGIFQLDEQLQENIESLKYYLSLLPEQITPFIKVEHQKGLSLSQFLSLFCTISVAPFHLIVDSPWVERFPYAFAVIGNGTPFEGAPSQRIEGALLIPKDSSSPYFQKLSDFLMATHAPIRVINEDEFIYSWDGVEELYFYADSLSKTGIRAIKGFEAAGGLLKSL